MRGGGPDDFEAGEGEGEEDEFGLQVCGVGGGGEGGVVEVGEGVEGEGGGVVEFDEEHGVFVVVEHGFRLVEEAAVFEGADEVADGFALDADVGGEHVVADGEHAGDYHHVAAVQEGGEGGAEFAHVDDDPGGFGGGGEAAAARDAGVDCAEELLLRVVGAFPVEGEGDGHVLGMVSIVACTGLASTIALTPFSRISLVKASFSLRTALRYRCSSTEPP